MKCSEALSAIEASFAMFEAYLSTLERLVFKCVPLNDKKLIRAWKNALCSQHGFEILQLLWKESSFVTEADLKEARIERSWPALDLSVNKLAKELAATTAGEAALNKSISVVVRAGTGFGLVETKQLHAKHNVISGTEKLHDVMLSMVQEWQNMLRRRRGGEQQQ